ncbi:hypothetical protein K2173_016802 [Erythroxylum novogranatense]|uniref:RING-CH-type domain-containing protein n=1 Tax=Erythroxylum novogranatense TaxID=1862640 RepID=A0AAV8SH63_9ROSI|nr:hypothetical protein K2173_016802 [Erythroxylum novogranatense]
MPTFHTHHLRRDQHSSPSSSDMSLSGEIGAHRESSASDCLSEVDLEGEDVEPKRQHSGDATKWTCRICYLGLQSHGQDSGVAIELGCSCKGGLGAVHRKCAETWFKIKGDTICEICGATALNVSGEQANEAHVAAAALSPAPAPAPLILVETRTFCHSRRVMNFLLACLLFAFVISWLFHFHVLN